MSIEVPKNIQVYIIMFVLFGGGTLFNQTNTGVTEDKIQSIEDRIAKLEVLNGITTNEGNNHEALFAHSGIFERTNQMQDIIDNLANRIQYLERLLIENDS